MSFSNDLLDGFDLLYRRTDSILKTNLEVSSFLKRVSAVEKEYARALQKVAKETRKDLVEKAPPIQKEVGTTLNAWDVILKELDKLGEHHNQFAEKLDTDLSKPLALQIKEKQKQRGKLEEDGKKLTKDFKAVKENLERSRQKYIAASKDAEMAEAIHVKAKGDVSKSGQLQKLATKATQSTERSNQADTEYKQTLTLTNQKQVEYYVTNQPALLLRFQQFEEDRLRYMKEIAEKFASLFGEFPGNYSSVNDSITSNIQSISIEGDIQSFVHENKTGVVQPPDIQYQSYDQEKSSDPKAKAPPGKIGKYKGPASNDIISSQEWGLSGSDQSLSSEEQVSKLQHQLDQLDKAVASETKSREGLENLVKFYGSDPAAQKKAEEQIQDCEQKLQKIVETKNYVQSQLDELSGSNPRYSSYDNNSSHNSSHNASQNSSYSDNSQYPKARALYDYVATASTELSFYAGDILYISEQDNSGWWYAMKDEKWGYVPNNYGNLKIFISW